LKSRILTNRFEIAALLRKLYSLDLEYEDNLLDAQVLALPYLRKLRSRLERKILSSVPGKDIRLTLSKYEVVAAQALLQNDLEDTFYCSIYSKIIQQYYSVMRMVRI
jgi:hypothetical protein